MTCNPKWQEISQNLGDFETAIDRPDIVAKVFNQKVKILLEDVNKKGIFGKCITYTYVIEFQKRGLPHMHMLLFIDKDCSACDCLRERHFSHSAGPERACVRRQRKID